MSRFERDLRESLRRSQPPEGFAEKVIARAHRAERPGGSWRWLAAAALVILMAGGTFIIREQERQIEYERNRDQLMAGLRITSSKLRRVDERLSAIQRQMMELHLEQ
jgi:hypothetical protein